MPKFYHLEGGVGFKSAMQQDYYESLDNSVSVYIEEDYLKYVSMIAYGWSRIKLGHRLWCRIIRRFG